MQPLVELILQEVDGGDYVLLELFSAHFTCPAALLEDHVQLVTVNWYATGKQQYSYRDDVQVHFKAQRRLINWFHYFPDSPFYTTIFLTLQTDIFWRFGGFICGPMLRWAFRLVCNVGYGCGDMIEGNCGWRERRGILKWMSWLEVERKNEFAWFWLSYLKLFLC